MVDYIIIGAGLSGGVLAHKLAEDNKKILLIERRNHIAGNLYDYINDKGIRIQEYGPHVFHMDSKEVYDFLTRFSKPISYETKVEAVLDGISTPSPFNYKTIDQFYDKEEANDLKKRLEDYYPNRENVTIVELLDSKDEKIKSFANFLFEKDYRLYTAKQWGLQPEEIDPSILKRVPITLSYNDRNFNDKYEFIPEGGFTNFYNNLINHSNIEAKLNEEALNHVSLEDNLVKYDGVITNIIYTGAIDELFDYKFGSLPYRTLRFEIKDLDINSYQNVAIVAYPQVPDYTRVTEYKKMPVQDVKGTSVAFEYPISYVPKVNEPYYPVLTDDSNNTYKQYLQYSKQFKNLTLCGRLADFKYYNMDKAVLRAFEVYEEIKRKDNI